jgi:prevent-host-death family protein
MAAIHDASASAGSGFGSVATLPDISASDLKNKFSEVVRRAAHAPVAITRHRRREFVILTAQHYDELQQTRLAPLMGLTTEFDRMVARMNTAKDRAARGRFLKATAVKPSAGLVKLKKQRAHAG